MNSEHNVELVCKSMSTFDHTSSCICGYVLDDTTNVRRYTIGTNKCDNLMSANSFSTLFSNVWTRIMYRMTESTEDDCIAVWFPQ